MDRYTTNIAKSQIGFIAAFVSPMYEVISTLMPHAKEVLDIANENAKTWKGLIPEYEEKLSKLIALGLYKLN